MTNGLTPLSGARNRLLREGVDSYAEAMIALAYFRHTICAIAKRVADRRRPKIATTFGVRVSAIAIAESGDEVDDFYEDNAAFLGSWVRIAGRGELYCGVDWREHEDMLEAQLHASFVADRKAAYVTIAKEVETKYGDSVVSNDKWWWVGVEEPISGKDCGQIEGRLGKVTDSLLKKLATINIKKLAQTR